MGLHLRPGHKIEHGRQGWVPVNYEDFIKDIEVGTIDLGHWGEKTENSLDGLSLVYSIPNPWAAAFLYNFVLRDNSHPLAESLIIQLLNLLCEFSLYDTADLIVLTKPEEDNPFYKLWSMAPDFIKYDDRVYFFKSKENDKVLGGLSKSSLIWTSQQYNARQKKEMLLDNKELISYLLHIKELKKPDYDETTYNTFWQHTLFSEILHKSNPSPIDNEIPLESPEVWLKKFKPKIEGSEFHDEASNCLVFDEKSLREGKSIFMNKANPNGFVDELRKRKFGKELPMNLGTQKWVILDYILEPYWINQNKVEHSQSEGIRSLENGFLYPVKPEYLQEFNLRLEDLKIEGRIEKGSQNARADIIWKEKRKVNLNSQFVLDTRSLAIWPPFQSKFIDNYVIEYDVKGIEKLEKLEFYDEYGSKIDYSRPSYHKGQNFRIYKLPKKFPRYIRILVRHNNSLVGGFIEIKERKPNIQQGKMIIGIDFGTSHTSIAYSKDGRTSLMSFHKSKTIIVADAQSKFGMLYNFLPPEFMVEKPNTKEVWEERKPWQPFQTQWMDNSNEQVNLQDQKIIEDGIIPFLHYAGDDTINKSIIGNLKWGAPLNISTYRTLFLKQLLIMAIAEAEAIGFEELEIRWSYPRAFSSSQYQNMRSFWNNVLNDIGIDLTTRELRS